MSYYRTLCHVEWREIQSALPTLLTMLMSWIPLAASNCWMTCLLTPTLPARAACVRFRAVRARTISCAIVLVTARTLKGQAAVESSSCCRYFSDFMSMFTRRAGSRPECEGGAVAVAVEPAEEDVPWSKVRSSCGTDGLQREAAVSPQRVLASVSIPSCRSSSRITSARPRLQAFMSAVSWWMLSEIFRLARWGSNTCSMNSSRLFATALCRAV